VTRITNGKVPGLYGGDFMFCPDDVSHRQTMIDEAKRQWNAGSLVHFSFNICPPTVGEECTWDSSKTCPPGEAHGEYLNGNGPGTQVQSKLSAAQWDQLVTDGTELNEKWKRRLDVYMYFLNQLVSEGIVPIIRPLHEMNGDWYWWSSGTADQYKKLWQFTYNFVNPRVDNLIWNWCVADPTWLDNNQERTWEKFYPGPDFVDIVSLSVYNGTGSKQPTNQLYQRIQNIGNGKVIAIGECGQLPTPETLRDQNKWAYFMNWADHISDPYWNSDREVRRTYNDRRVLTQGQVRRFRNVDL
jgi:mannan endo-1,4-beta-mannosidase